MVNMVGMHTGLRGDSVILCDPDHRGGKLFKIIIKYMQGSKLLHNIYSGKKAGFQGFHAF